MEERDALEATLRKQVERVQHELHVLLVETGYRLDCARSGEGYYWQNFRETVVKIKSEANKLTEWVQP